jgi:hypothetical protein
VLVTGLFNDSVDFGGGPLTSAGTDDIFVAKYDAAGNHEWSRAFGDTDQDWGYGVAADDAGHVFITGLFRGTVDFGGGPLTSAGSGDIFLAKYDAAGNHVWSRRFGNIGLNWSFGVAVDAAGNAVVTGLFGGTVDFGGGPLTGVLSETFVAKYDGAGNHVWSRQFSSNDDDRGQSVAVDRAGNVLVTGLFQGTVDFGGGPVTSAGHWDIYVAKLDATGIHVWSRGFGSVSADWGNSVSADDAGNALVTGGFLDTMDAGGGPLTSAGGRDIFVASFEGAVPTGVETVMPQPAALYQNVPNPFNPTTTIRFDVPEGGANTTLAIYDVGGRHVRTLVDKHMAAGTYYKDWDGSDANGNAVASGVYFYRLTAGNHALTRKAVLLK